MVVSKRVRRYQREWTIRLAGIAFAALAVFSLAAAADIKHLRSIEGISEYALDNGLQLLLFPDPSKDTVTVNITYRVGSKHENYGETGMAHLLEHLLFKGTPNHPDITAELTERGARANGTTWLERTNYYQTLKATAENLEWALAMEADRMLNSFVSQEDLDSEMTVVRNEFERGENSPRRILAQRVYSAAYNWHNYGNSTIGARSDIENVKIESLQAFYRRYYQPDNASLIVAGNIDIDKTLALVERHFGALPRPARQLPELYTREPVQDGERSVTLRRVGSQQVVSAAYHIPSGLHEDFAPLSVLAIILGDTPSGRLHKNLVEKQLATAVSAWPNQQRDPGLLYFSATADLDMDLQKTEQALLQTMEAIAAAPITDKEVQRAQRQIAKQMRLRFNSSQSIAIELSEWIGIGDWRMYFLNRDRLEQVTVEDVQRVANTYLLPANRTLGRFMPTEAPQRALIPPAPDVATLLDGYTGRAAIAAGENFEPTPENIAARLRRHSEGAVNLALLPLKTRGESVDFELRLGLGDEKSLMHKSAVARLTAAMLLRGSERFSREDIQDEFDRLKAAGGLSWRGQSVYAMYQTTADNLAAVISHLHEVLTTASFPQKEFELLKTQALARLEAEKTNPQALAMRAHATSFNRHPQGHVYRAKTIDEEIAAIAAVKLRDVKRFYRDYYGAADMQMGVVGAFDESAVRQQATELFSGWKPRKNYRRIADAYKSIDRKDVQLNTPDKKNAVFIAATNLNITNDHADAPALYLVSHMLGGGLISSRLATRIRQQDGLSYGVGAFLRVRNLDSNASFMAYAISAPENTEKVHAAFLEEMNRAVEEGFEAGELAAAKSGFLDGLKVNFSNNGFLAGRLAGDILDGRDISAEREFIDSVQALTVEDVNRVMKQYLQPQEMTVIKAGDLLKVSQLQKP